MTPAEILLKAAEIIEERGWTQGQYEDPESGCVCAEGALNVAAGFRPTEFPARHNPDLHAAREVMDRWIVDAVNDITWIHEWNDEPGRTQAEVVAALRAAAVSA